MDQKFSRLATPVYDALAAQCAKIVSTEGTVVSVTARPTDYVISGRTYVITSPRGQYRFWLGVNGPRLFFIVYITGLSDKGAREAFAFCFGGAQKVGWDLNYEPINDGVSIWATCMTNRDLPLTAQNPNISVNGDAVPELTAEGAFWVNDVAMMVQSWVRTCERRSIANHHLEPAPL